MSKLAKAITVIICCMALIFGVGCADNETNNIETAYPLDASSIYVYVDKETGVNYLLHTSGGICPRYNADGSLYVGGTE